MRKMPGMSRYFMLLFVGVAGAIIQYPMHLFRLDLRSAINELFSAADLSELSPMDLSLFHASCLDQVWVVFTASY